MGTAVSSGGNEQAVKVVKITAAADSIRPLNTEEVSRIDAP
ncbi:MAG: hypothetical protein ABW022_01615 [Actinoplanes sp.]